MPWNRTDPEKERMALVAQYQLGSSTMTALCQALGVSRPTLAEVRAVFAEAFQEYGLPLALRTDNRLPFAASSVAGLSALSLWWLRGGILLKRIALVTLKRTDDTSGCAGPSRQRPHRR